MLKKRLNNDNTISELVKVIILMNIGKETRYLLETKALFCLHNSLWLDKGFEYQNKLPCTNMSYEHERMFCEKKIQAGITC